MTKIDYTGVMILPTQTMHYYRQITQNYHTFVLFDSPNMGNLMTPAIFGGFPVKSSFALKFSHVFMIQRGLRHVPLPGKTLRGAYVQ